MKLKKWQWLTSAVLGVVFAVPMQVQAEEVNVYSARKAQLIEPILDKFTAKTGIEVNLVTSKADQLLKRLESEGRRSPADILITTDAGRLHRAKEAGVLQAKIAPKLLEKVPASLQDNDGEWIGLTTRARVIVYAKDRVDPQDLSTYEGLADGKWNDKICIRSSNNIYNQSLVASMIAHKGEQTTEQWAKGLVENMARKPKGGDRDQVMAVAAGQCDLAVVNTYYLGQMLNGSDASQKAAANQVAVFWPNQEDRGTHINVSGVGITKSAKNIDNANKLIEFMLSDAAQKWYADTNNEYPVVSGIEPSATLQAWGDFHSDRLNLYKLGTLNPEAVRVMDRANWR